MHMQEKTPREIVADMYISTEIARRTHARIIDSISGERVYNHDELVAKRDHHDKIVEASRKALTEERYGL